MRMVLRGESEMIGRNAAKDIHKQTKRSVWSDVPRRLVTVCVGIPFVWKLLERPATAYVFFFGAHAISAWEYSLLEPSNTTTAISNFTDEKQGTQFQPSTKQLSKPTRLLFCLTSLILGSISDSSACLFSFAVSLAAGIFAVTNRHHWIIGLLVVTLPFRAWCNLVYQFENSENGMDSSSFASTIAVLLTVWNADTGALVVGRLFGRKNTTATTARQVSNTNRLPLWIQRISPAKTMEGFLGGMVCGIGTAIWLVPLLLNTFSVDTSPGYRKLWGLDETKNEPDSKTFIVGFGILNRVVLGFCLSILAILGDLVESSIKRRSRSKDSGSVLPGHGGILDRFDSSLLAVLFYRVALEYANNLVSEGDDIYYPARSITRQGNIEL